MDIVIIANFCGDFSPTDNGRFNYLAHLLCKDNSVEIITSDFFHLKKEHRAINPELPYKLTMIHEPGYKTNTSVSRILSHIAFGNNLIKYLKKRKKPDVVYCAVPSLTGPYKVSKYCERNDVRFIIDIQDLWPDGFVSVFKESMCLDVAMMPLKAIENAIFRRADQIVAVSNTFVQRALEVNQKCSNGLSCYLGTSIKVFDDNCERNFIKRNGHGLRLGYCGTLGSSYDIPTVLEALRIVKEKGYAPPKFILMGDGPCRDEFEKCAKKYGIDAEFTGLLPYDKMCGMLKSCDIVINPIHHGAAQSIINKHADYAASGLPVISTQECKEYRDLISTYQMGFSCQNESANDVAEKLIILLKDPDLRNKMGLNARRCAEEKFDRRVTYQEIIAEILNTKKQQA